MLKNFAIIFRKFPNLTLVNFNNEATNKQLIYIAELDSPKDCKDCKHKLKELFKNKKSITIDTALSEVQ
jgi:hypothetical protein